MNADRANVQMLDVCHTPSHDGQQSLDPVVVHNSRGYKSFNMRRVFEEANEGTAFEQIQADRDGQLPESKDRARRACEIQILLELVIGHLGGGRVETLHFETESFEPERAPHEQADGGIGNIGSRADNTELPYPAMVPEDRTKPRDDFRFEQELAKLDRIKSRVDLDQVRDISCLVLVRFGV